MPALLQTDGILRIETAPVFKPLLYPSRYKCSRGGRGSGKSHDRAEALVERCIERQGTSWACIREVQKSLKMSAKRLVDNKIREFKATDSFHITETYIGTPGGGRIIFEGMQNHTADSIQSLEGFDGAWVEEARSLSQRSLDLLRPTIRKENSELWFNYNPRTPKDPVDAFFMGMQFDENHYCKAADAIMVEANWYDNPWFPEVLRAEKDYDLRRDPDKYAHIWLGGYEKHSTARVFHNWTVEEFESPDNAHFLLGGDWGFSVDPTVLVRSFVGHFIDGVAISDPEGKTLFIDQEAYEVGCEIDQIPALFAGDDRRIPPRWTNPLGRPGIPGAAEWPITADSQRPDTISYLKNRGFNIRPAVKGKGSVEDGVEFLKTFDIVVHPRCVHTADELASYSFKVDKLTGLVVPKLADAKNHVIDSLRYSAEGLRRSLASMVAYL